MTYEEAKKIKAVWGALADDASKALQAYPRDANGLTPKAVRLSPEYISDKKTFNTAFDRAKAINRVFMKEYKKEYAQERREKRIAGIR